MAKIKFGMMMTDARGKLGGQVFSKNRAGAYIRTKVTPTNPQTSFQTLARVLFAAISQAWSGLTQSGRDAWNNAVSDWQKTDIFGDLKQPSGKALFQRLNNQAQAAGYAAVTAAPARLEMVEGVITAVALEAGVTEELTLSGPYGGADARVVVLGTGSLSQGTSFVKNKLRQIYSPVANAYSASAAYAAYTAKFGVPSAGDNVYFGVKYVLPNGQASPVQIIKSVVTEP